MQLSISVAARMCGVCTKTIRRWDQRGHLTPFRTPGGHRRYHRTSLLQFLESGTYSLPIHLNTGVAAIYSRVSAVKQKKDRDLQTQTLIKHAIHDGFVPKIYTDIGSGLNDRRPRFLQLLQDGVHGEMTDYTLHFEIDLPGLAHIRMK